MSLSTGHFSFKYNKHHLNEEVSFFVNQKDSLEDVETTSFDWGFDLLSVQNLTLLKKEILSSKVSVNYPHLFYSFYKSVLQYEGEKEEFLVRGLVCRCLGLLETDLEDLSPEQREKKLGSVCGACSETSVHNELEYKGVVHSTWIRNIENHFNEYHYEFGETFQILDFHFKDQGVYLKVNLSKERLSDVYEDLQDIMTKKIDRQLLLFFL